MGLRHSHFVDGINPIPRHASLRDVPLPGHPVPNGGVAGAVAGAP